MEVINKHEQKVYVRTNDNERVFGYILLSETERLQDLMNDERKFIPLKRLKNGSSAVEDTFIIRMINKDSIAYIEES